MGKPENIIRNRKLTLCDATADWSVPELLQICPSCDGFLLHCCSCHTKLLLSRQSYPPATPCHHFRIIFTDGACTNNGRSEAKAGVGVAYGNNDDSQLSQPITDKVDNFPLRSNQRAELCAAKLGLEFFRTKESTSEAVVWIIATDSEYVVKGMTEWLPKWKKNNWRTAKGTRPTNLDLFRDLDRVVTTLEVENITIGFWHIPREHNRVADYLAKEAAVHGDEAKTEGLSR